MPFWKGTTMSEQTIGVYDLARWKPITFEQFANELLAASIHIGDLVDVPLKAEGVDETRSRLVAYADVRLRVGADYSAPPSHEPYLMVMGNPLAEADRNGNTGIKTVCFIRTDVDLAGL